MKKFLIFFILFLIIFTSKTYAVSDLEIICNENNCQASTQNPIFNLKNTYPGFVAKKNIDVINNQGNNCLLNFSVVKQTDLLSKIFNEITLSITKDSQILYTDTLENTNKKESIKLDNLKNGDNNNYVWQLSLSQDADNSFANIQSNFNINFDFVCQDSSNGSSENNNPSTPICTQSVPDAPSNFYARRNTTGSVTLFWKHPATPFSNYLVAYGTSPGVYLYGNPNVGNDDHYTVRSLTYGAQYCFYVRTINGCMPGGRTNEVCVNTGSSVVANVNPPAGFQPNVLGAETQSSTLPDNSSNPTVAGVNNENNKQIIFYILSFLFILVGASHIFKYFHKFKTG